MLVQLNDAAHDAGIILKMAVPIRISEHDVGSAVWTMLIGGVKEAAKIGLNAERVEIVSGDFEDPRAGWDCCRCPARPR